jgi:DNA-binding transcriptional ArsR family regulator
VTAVARRRRLEGPAPVFEALGDATRLALVTRLCDAGPMSIARLTSGTDISRQGVTKHLRVLEGAGIVRGARRGRERIWEVDARQLEIARRFLEQASQRWGQALDRLRAFVEDREA